MDRRSTRVVAALWVLTAMALVGSGPLTNATAAAAQSRLPSTYLSLRYAKHTSEVAIQVRSSSSGTIRSTVLPFAEASPVSAQRDAVGDIWTVTTTGCLSTIRRITPAGRTTVIRTLPQPAYDASVSPTGRSIAYLLGYLRCPQDSGGESSPDPGRLAVTDLATGKTVVTREPAKRVPQLNALSLTAPRWSPDGRHLVATTLIAGPLLVFSGSHPSFQDVRVVRDKDGCKLASPSWGLAGIFAGEICKRQSFSPSRLVRLSPAGTVTASWKLPSCIDGFSTALDASFRDLLLGIGHGYGNCDLAHATDEAATIDGSRIRVISQDPSARGSNSWPLGW